jgi:hypothetical protein
MVKLVLMVRIHIRKDVWFPFKSYMEKIVEVMVNEWSLQTPTNH